MKNLLTRIGLLSLLLSGVTSAWINSQSTSEIFISGTEGVVEFRIPALITLKSGTVMAVCDARVDKKGDVPNNIDQVIRRSRDNGRTWDNIQRVVDFANQEGAADPSLIQDPETGRVFVFYTYCPGRNDVTEGGNAKRRHLQLQYVFSDDEGDSWSLPVVVEHGIKKDGWHSMWPAPGRGTLLSGGRLAVPVTVFDLENFHTFYLYSDDHGDSWQLSSKVGTTINEATLVELEKNKLFVNARNRTGNRAVVLSNDGGETWSDIIYHEELPEPGCQGSCIGIRDGQGKKILLFSNPANQNKRSHMTVKASYDNGKTWPVQRLIHEGPAAYSCLTVMPDGEIGLLYENGEKSPYEKITFIKFPLDWIVNK